MTRRVCVKGDAEGRESREKDRQWSKRGVWKDTHCVVVVLVAVVVDVVVVVVVVMVWKLSLLWLLRSLSCNCV